MQHLVVSAKMRTISEPRSMRQQERNIDVLLDMADSLVVDEELEASYEAYLEDASALLETHPCSSDILALPNLKILCDRKQEQTLASNSVASSRMVNLQDPLLQSLLSLLDSFLSNDIETNLGLTQVVACLASCGSTSMEGWLLLPDMTQEPLPQEDRGSDQPSTQRALSEELDSRVSSEDDEIHSGLDGATNKYGNDLRSPMFESLSKLVARVHQFSKDIEDFDTYLAERKHVFKVGDEIESALKDPSEFPRHAQGSKATSPSRKRNPHPAISISERLLSGDNSATVSRASSPRGRRQAEQAAPTLISKLSHLRISPTSSPSRTASTAHSPSPFRKGSLSSTPPRGLRSPISSGNALRQKIRMATNGTWMLVRTPDVRSEDGNSARTEPIGPEVGNRESFIEISLSHLLTNVIILQEFLLEFAAIIEVRASMFGEVTLD